MTTCPTSPLADQSSYEVAPPQTKPCPVLPQPHGRRARGTNRWLLMALAVAAVKTWPEKLRMFTRPQKILRLRSPGTSFRGV
jgi:hypothetical protein